METTTENYTSVGHVCRPSDEITKVLERTCSCMYMSGVRCVVGSRQLIFLCCLGCVAIALIVVCLTLLASYFIPSAAFLMYIHVYTCTCWVCCVALLCLTLLASFFLPSHLSLKHLHMYLSQTWVSRKVLYHLSYRGNSFG